MSKCWLCLRITPKQLAKAIHTLSFPEEKKHDVLLEAISLVEKAYEKKPPFFCGKGAYRIIGGLLYLLSFKYCKTHLSLRRVAADLDYLSKIKTTNEVTIRLGQHDWRKLLPEIIVTK